MTCRCSPSLDRLMAAFKALGHINSGCCGDLAHQQRTSDHNPDGSGYAHAQDIHELADHDMQPFVNFIMKNPAKFAPVKYCIYEGRIYYPHDGARRAGSYPYTGPNAHAAHLHVSIFANATFYAGDWHVGEAYGQAQPALDEEDDMPTAQGNVPPGGQEVILFPFVDDKLAVTLRLGSQADGANIHYVVGGADGERVNADHHIGKGGRRLEEHLQPADEYVTIVNDGPQPVAWYWEAVKVA